MRNITWKTIGIAIFVIAVLLYLMQSDFMQQKSGGLEEPEIATSMDTGSPEEEMMMEDIEGPYDESMMTEELSEVD